MSRSASYPPPPTAPQRSSFAVSRSVWGALLLREGVTRLLATRTAWFWFLFEPIVHVLFMVLMSTVIRVRTINGISTPVWLVGGLFTFLMCKRIALRSAHAVGNNQSLFAYRQIAPVDLVLGSCLLEGFLLMLVFGALLGLGELAGLQAFPADPIAVMVAMFGAWLMAFGFGCAASVGGELVPGFRRVIAFLMIPLYFLSGVITQLSIVPQPYRGWVLMNPLAQALELVRHGFSPLYHVDDVVSMGYLYTWALIWVFLGLALQRRFATRLKARRK